MQYVDKVCVAVILVTVSMGLLGCPLDELLPREPVIWHVNCNSVSEAPDGLTWATAFKNIQDAVDVLESHYTDDEIWVAAGTYSTPEQNNNRVLSVKNPVAIYGGFLGIETDWNMRNWPINKTILNGTATEQNPQARHVVVIEESDVILDGFTITGGDTTFNTNLNDNVGGGILVYISSPTINNCIINENNATHGGGICIAEGSPAISDCTFTNNTADANGGGLVCIKSNPVLADCTFSENIALGNGGGIVCSESSPIISSCTISDNVAVNGGGMLNEEESSPTVTQCTFDTNRANQRGGGMHNTGKSLPTISSSTFSSNYSATVGAGISNEDSSNATIAGCTFTNNSAENDAGGIYNEDSVPTVTGCTFTNNSPNDTEN